MTGLQLHQLTKKYGRREALREVNLQVGAEELIAIVGPSGCGKTTLLRIVAGLERADHGSVIYDERLLDALPPRKRDVAMVFQGESLYPHLSAYENLAFPLRMRRTAPREIASLVHSTAERVGVSELLDRMPNTLSGGERQRVAIGRALIRSPRVLLLDEPFAHLDLPLRQQLGRELLALREHWKATTLFVTHDHLEAVAMAARVAVMNAGQVQQFDTAAQICSHPVNEFVANFFRPQR